MPTFDQSLAGWASSKRGAADRNIDWQRDRITQYEIPMVGQQRGRAQGDFDYQWNQRREQLPWNFAANGTMNSGIYRRALGDYAGQRQRAFADMSAGFQEKEQGLRRTATVDLEAQRNSALDEIAAERQYREMQMAASLRNA
jgi:hypothetical protein